jgi:phospho-N-acetylmuramoyl-pentapeptide-transferase
VRGYGMQTHLVKSGTPTMGGVLILLASPFHAAVV